MKKTLEIPVNDIVVSYNIEGETAYGAEEVLLEQDDNLIAETSWYKEGYTVQPFLEDAQYQQLIQGIRNMFIKVLNDAGVNVPHDFTLENYHHFVDDKAHAEVVRCTRGFVSVNTFPVDFSLITNRISEICNTKLTPYAQNIHDDSQCRMRVVRPRSIDNNPPHRDIWLDFLRNSVNIYLPICGSNEYSSLPLVPGSHLWKESEIERTVAGAKTGGLTYTVPSVTGAKRDMKMVRPNPSPNEVLVFSPYLIHGGAANLNEDTTRISLEIRFWRG